MQSTSLYQRSRIWALLAYNDFKNGRIDLAEGQPDVQKGVKALHRSDWSALASLYEARPPSDRYHFLQGVTHLSRVECAWPTESTRALENISVGLCVGWAWRHRGYGLGASVTEDGARKMWALLERALEITEDLGEEADSAALAAAIRAQTGVDGDRAALQGHLEAAAKTGEANIYVCRNHLWLVAPKWHGSAEEIHAAAREYTNRPANPAWLALPVMAHIEVRNYRLDMSTEADARAARAWFNSSPEYGKELEFHDDAFWKMSERAPGKMSHAEAAFAHNTFAYALYHRGLHERLGRHVKAIGKHLLLQPWSYDGLERPSLRVLRRLSGLR